MKTYKYAKMNMEGGPSVDDIFSVSSARSSDKAPTTGKEAPILVSKNHPSGSLIEGPHFQKNKSSQIQITVHGWTERTDEKGQT